MNILLISQCDKRALTETRRILDQFAERRGDRTWQTPITQAGLDTLRRLLRKTARKNTAVACHWIRGLDHSELLWIVGDASRFNAQGAVPTDTTTRNVLRRDSENDWHTGDVIRLLAQLAALLHDLGKASVAFQERLKNRVAERNLYRHEWVSLRMFAAFVGGDDDATWLQRLIDLQPGDEADWLAPGRYQRDGIDATQPYPFRSLPPLAAAVAWLVVTHHRLPMLPVIEDDGRQQWLGARSKSLRRVLLESPLDQVAHHWNEMLTPASAEAVDACWEPAGPLPVVESCWRACAARVARRLLERQSSSARSWLDDPYVMHLARLCLMLADHDYSRLPADSPQRVKGGGRTELFANTGSDGQRKQHLDEHLLGVARDAGLIAHALPGFERQLPALRQHRGLRKRSADPRFAWQDKAADAATALRERAREHGAFVVNMASTGCGKTLANARIVYALADPQRGLRATYALGLRTLTQQTGRCYRDDLHLSDDDLAVLVGGSASRELFEFYERQAEAAGSASIQSLIEEDSYVVYEGNTAGHPLLDAALRDPDVRRLLLAPMLVCTVDHMAPATEGTRAGRQIAPMLRLLSADLILDELDDYDLDDLPALTRLVHWAGLLGTRVVLSSATLPPALIEGMFLAYQAGRRHYRRNRGGDGGLEIAAPEVPCLWVDEFGVQEAMCGGVSAEFGTAHGRFIDHRAVQLSQPERPPLRRGNLVPLELNKERERQPVEFAEAVLNAVLHLHSLHSEICPVSGKRISFGIVRMANIDPLFDTGLALFAKGAPEGMRLHLCIYHARFPLVQRSAIEHQLDTTFNRRGDGKAVYALPAVRQRIDAHSERDQVFLVLASPVCEVGRDWDADWAVAEPSSMRSLIQLAGRVQRHRRKLVEQPNLLIFDTTLRHFRYLGKDEPAFVHPGFERANVDRRHRFRLETHRLGKLLDPEEWLVLTSLPRIRPRAMAEWRPKFRLVDLEQARIAASMLPRERLPPDIAIATTIALERDESAPGWLYPQAALTGVLQQQQRFREDTQRTVTLVFLPDEDAERLVMHRVEEKPKRRGEPAHVVVDKSQRLDVAMVPGPRIGPWGDFDLLALLRQQAEDLEEPLADCAKRFSAVNVPDRNEGQGWRYHPWLGFAERR